MSPLLVFTLPDVPLTAYIDESVRRRRGESVCVYVLAAVVVDDDELDGVRDGMRGLRRGKANVIHWRDELPERLPVIAAAVAAMPIAAVVTVSLHAEKIASERARRISLKAMLSELMAEGVDRVVFESRPSQDRLDRDLIWKWRQFGWPEALVRTDFLRPSEEPALWAADCVAGAIAWWLGGGDVGWRELEPRIRIVEVAP